MTSLPTFTSGTPGKPTRYDLSGVTGAALVLRRLHDIVITGGSFTSISLSGCQRVDISFFEIHAPAYASSNGQAVRIVASSECAVHDGYLFGALATNGVDPAAKALDKTGNVKGWPCGKAVNIDSACSDLRAERLVIEGFHKGIVFAGARIHILRCRFTGLRTTPISGSPGDDCEIRFNHGTNSNPWNFGGNGDHGDRIHVWTDKAPVRRLRIGDNVFTQGDGAPMLGIYLDDNGKGLGFDSPWIHDNQLVEGTGQGLLLERVFGTPASPARIEFNSLVWSGYGTKKTNTPRCDLKAGCRDVIVRGHAGPVTLDKSLTPAARASIKIIAPAPVSATRTEVPGDLRLRAERAEARVAALEAELAGMRESIAFYTAMRAVAPVAAAVLDGAA